METPEKSSVLPIGAFLVDVPKFAAAHKGLVRGARARVSPLGGASYPESPLCFVEPGHPSRSTKG